MSFELILASVLIVLFYSVMKILDLRSDCFILKTKLDIYRSVIKDHDDLELNLKLVKRLEAKKAELLNGL